MRVAAPGKALYGDWATATSLCSSRSRSCTSRRQYSGMITLSASIVSTYSQSGTTRSGVASPAGTRFKPAGVCTSRKLPPISPMKLLRFIALFGSAESEA